MTVTRWLIAIALAATGWAFKEHADCLAKERDAALKDARDARAQLVRSIELMRRTDEQLQQYQQKKAEVQNVDREVIKKVIEYRDRVPDRCNLSAEWVQVHNTAILSTIPQDSTATGINDTAPDAGKTVDDAKALEVVTANYRVCVSELARFQALQNWLQAITQP